MKFQNWLKRRTMVVTLWQDKLEQKVHYRNPKTGKILEFESAHELVQFLQEKALSTKITIKVEQV